MCLKISSVWLWDRGSLYAIHLRMADAINFIYIVKQMKFNLESDEGELCTESSLVWNKLICSSCFELSDVHRFHCQKSIQLRDQFCILTKWRNQYGINIVSYQNFFCVYITICTTLHYLSMCLTSAWVICMSQLHLNCSVGQVGQQMWPTFNSGSDTCFGMRIYEGIKIISYTKIACCYSKDSQNLELSWFTIDYTCCISLL